MELCNGQTVLGSIVSRRADGWRDFSRPCSNGWLPRLPQPAWHSPARYSPIPRLTSAQSGCPSFPYAECAERLKFTFMVEAQVDVSRPLVGLLDAQLLVVGQLLSKPLLVKTEIKASIPVAYTGWDAMPHPACRHANVWFAPKKNPFGTVSPTRPAKRTGRLRVRAASNLLLSAPSFLLEPRFLAGQAAASANTRTVADWRPFPPVALWREVYDASASAYGFPVLEIHRLFIYGSCSAGRKVAFLPCIRAVRLVPFSVPVRGLGSCETKSDLGSSFILLWEGIPPHSSEAAHEDTPLEALVGRPPPAWGPAESTLISPRRP